MFIEEYFAALWAHWWALMSCSGFTILSIAIGMGSQHPRLKGWLKAWEWKLALCLAALFFVLSGYYAWRDQYRESQISRDTGVLTLASVEGGLTSDPSTHQQGVTVALDLRNATSELIQYRVDAFDLYLDSHVPSGNYVNRGGYVYASQLATFRSPLISHWQGDQNTFKGTLYYAITYHIVGSKQEHHTAKTIMFPCSGSTFSGLNYTTLEEYED